MAEITWEHARIFIQQRGFLNWKWEVRDKDLYYLGGGQAMTKRAALRRSARFRKGVIDVA